jgi:hypothetical protein
VSNASHAITCCLNALANYLTTQIVGLTVYKEWPSANQVLAYPSVTIFTGQVKGMNRTPEQMAITEPDVNNQVVVTEILGEYDAKMQLDLWCANKFQRDTVLGQIFDAINLAATDDTGDNNAAGLSLQLTDYFDDYVRFDIDGFTYVDDMAAAERQERRVKIDLLLNCRAIKDRTLYAITQVQASIGTSLDGTNMADDTTGTELHLVVP